MQPIALAHELVFIDATVEDYESLVQGLRSGISPVVIAPHDDGIELITRTLSRAQNVRHVHIISHGAPGTVRLGSTVLSLNNFRTHVHHLKQWTNAFAKGCELLLYGCNVAAGDRGARFVQKLASYLSIPVAASTHRVGHAQWGGSWELDYQTSVISAKNAINPSTCAMYQGAFVINALYASDNNGDIYVVDIETAEAVDVGDLSFPTFAIARNETNNEGPIVYIGNGSNRELVDQFNPEDGTNQSLGTTNLDQVFLKLAQAQNGRFYALTNSTANLFASATPPDPANPGAAIDLGVVANLPIGSGDAAFNPTNEDELFVLVTNTATNIFALYTIDVGTVGTLTADFVGNVIADGVLLTPGLGSGSLAFGPDGDLYLTSNNPNPSLYRIPVVNGVISTDDNDNIDAEFIGNTVDALNPETALIFRDFATLPTNPEDPGEILTVSKTDNRDTIMPGEETVYDIVVANESEATIQFLEVFDEVSDLIIDPSWTATIPADGGLFLESGSNRITGTGDIDFIATLDNDVSITITLTGTIAPTAPAGTLSNTTEANTSTGVSATATDTTQIIDDHRNDDDCTDGAEIRGDNTNNRLIGTPDNDPIFGLGGADTLIGLECNDDLFGGEGNDVLRGNEDSDVLEGNQGNDRLNGGGGEDNLNGGTGNDIAQGGSQDDVVNGRRGNDILSGNSGDDLLNGDAGNDVLNGNKGDDEANGGLGDDTIQGNGGNDLITGDFGDDLIRGNRGNDTIQAGQDDDTIFGNSGNDRINGGKGDDSLKGQKGRDILRGRRGRDQINGGRGNDLADGGADEDRIRTNQGNDRVFGGNQSDTITTNGGQDTINAGLGNDVVKAGKGADIINGRRGNDDIDAGDGNDIITGSLGRDRIVGRRGNDVVDGGEDDDNIRTNQGDDIVRARKGNDRIITNGGKDEINAGVGNDVVKAGKGADIINGRRGDDKIHAGEKGDVITGFLGNDIILAGRNNDRVSGGDGDDQIEGGPGRDVIRSNRDDDAVSGNIGNDIIISGVGADTVNGNGGDDTINGRRGDDKLFGGDGNDIITGDDGLDQIFGNRGNDNLDGGRGEDFIQAGGGNDTVAGVRNADMIIGRGGADRINGGGGNDELQGGDGRDTLYGRRGRDIINGGDGRDTLVGGINADTLTGGLKADSFVFEALNTGVDTIADFEVDRDRIVLTPIFEEPPFIGGNPLSHVRVQNIGGGSSVIQVDANGTNPGRDFVDLVILEGVPRRSFDNSAFVIS